MTRKTIKKHDQNGKRKGFCRIEVETLIWKERRKGNIELGHNMTRKECNEENRRKREFA